MAFPTGISRAWQRISKSLFQTGENTLEVYNGVKPQALYVYNTRADAANWERGIFRWSANALEIGTESAGTGQARGTNLYADTNKRFSVGAFRVLQFYGDANAGYIYGYPRVVITSFFNFIDFLGYNTEAVTLSLSGFSVGRDSAATAIGFTYAALISDKATRPINLVGGAAWPSATTNLGGGVINITGGAGASSSSGAANGGSVAIAGGAGYGTGTKGIVTASRLRADGFATATAAKTADYTATLDDGTIEVDASGAARTITLFAASGNAGKILVIKKTDSSANAVTVDGNASETIDGAATISLASQYSTAILQVNAAGTGWSKLAGV